MSHLKFFIVFIVSLFSFHCSAIADVLQYNNPEHLLLINTNIEKFEDSSDKLTINDIVHSAKFTLCKDGVPNFGITNAACWLKFSLRNNTSLSDIFLQLPYPILDHVTLYIADSNGIYKVINTGEDVPINSRQFKHQNFIFDVRIPPGATKTFYLQIRSTEQILVPLSAGSYQRTFEIINQRDVLSGIYCGIILVMILYNLFVFFTVRDKSYIYYVLYILFVGLTQIGFQGYSYRFFWPSNPWLANQSIILFPALTGITAIEFFKHFLQIKTTAKKYYILILNLLNAFYIVNCLLSISGFHQLSQQLLQPNAMIASLVIVYIAIALIRKGNRSAGFFLIAWAAFLVGILIFILKDIGVLPYNNFTVYILHIGSAIEVILLSLALADKINIFRKEKEVSQQQALAALQDNARIIRKQNLLLEAKVNERTQELKITNEELNTTLEELKQAELQLVESEKMASLGQLTAGIAHEINNPINFVTSNVKPLRRDVEILLDTLQTVEQIGLAETGITEKKQKIAAYKEEIDFDYLKVEIEHLLKGINEGASRTAEIVKGLRIFSRLDEDDLKLADMNDGLDSTLVITNNLLNNRIEVVKNYGDIPQIECYPGKLNQVFLNIISNGIYAINKKFGENKGGVLTVATEIKDNKVLVKIADNGTGMDEVTKKKLFEPFFTTKDVGEGTGLGMSIAYNTINKHNGQIHVHSVVGEGTEFIIELPIHH